MIESQANKKYKAWSKLLTRKYRDKEGLYIIEGANLIVDAVRCNGVISDVVVSCKEGESEEELLKAFLGEHFDEVNAYLSEHHIPISFLREDLYGALSSTENGRSILAVVARRTWTEEELLQHGNIRNVLVLDRLQDPGNIGTIIRTVDGAGFAGIVALKGTADLYAPKVVRSCAGSLFRVPVLFLDDSESLLALAKRLGLRTVATGLRDESGYYYEENLMGNIALIIGNEGGGVSKELLEKSDVVVKIPMYGNIDSLNASVAAGVIIYECVRQNDRSMKEVK